MPLLPAPAFAARGLKPAIIKLSGKSIIASSHHSSEANFFIQAILISLSWVWQLANFFQINAI